MYSTVPTIQLDDVSTSERRFSVEAPSTISVSSKDSSLHITHRRRHDRRKERLNTELLNAVLDSSYDDVVKLLDAGASPNATCRPNRVSVLHIAALKGDSYIVHHLLLNGASRTLRDRAGRQAVHYAAWAGQTDSLQLIIGVDPSLVNSPVQPVTDPDHDMDCLDSWNHDHDKLNHLVPDAVDLLSTPLHLACKTSCYNSVILLLGRGADVQKKDAKGLSPLDVTGLFPPPTEHVKGDGKGDGKSLAKGKSTEKNKPEGGKTNLSEGGTPNFLSLATDMVTMRKAMVPKGEKPSHKIVCALIQKGAKMPRANVILKQGSVINQNKMTVTTLHTAVANEEIELIDCLLRNNACLMTWNENGETPLHLAVKKWLLEPLKKMLAWDSGGGNQGNSSIVDVRDSLGRTPLHLAVMQEWPNGVALLLEAGADVTTTSNDSETVFHLAAERGNKTMLEELLSIPDAHKVMEYRNSYYHTPLCRAVENKHLSCVELLWEHGADTTILTPRDVTLLHIAALQDSHEILGFLLAHGADKVKDIRCREIKGGMTALHIAAKEGYTACVQELLNAGCDVFLHSDAEEDRQGTVLHLAAKDGHLETVKAIIKHDIATMEAVNVDGWQPLHIAAGFGRSECVKHMVQSGADISASVWDDTGRKTALDIIMYCVPQPLTFLENLLDSYMIVNEHPLSDPDCEIELKYDILAPGGRSCRQLKVLSAILNNGNQTLQERLLLHPLIESFLYFKWRKLRIFFTVIIALHVMLTLALTTLAHLSYVEKGPSTIIFVCSEVARGALFTALIPIVALEIIHASQLQRYYFKDSESWVKWSVVVTSSIVAIVDPNLAWPRHIASVAVLLSWIELLFLLARLPKWGFYVLMFSRVASNVFKVLATFTFLVLGFTFAFLIHFEAAVPFRNVLEAVIKVVVMMLEFDYENMFEQFKEVNAFSIIGRLIFLTFVILVAMVMMNLMVGLAVSDITLLETQGKTQRLAKQTAFLSLLELTVYNERLRKLLPKRWHAYLQKMRAVPDSSFIKPATSIDSLDSDMRHLPKSIKESVLNKMWSSSQNNDDLELTVSLHDINYKIEQLAGIVNDKLTDISSSTSSSHSSKSSKSSLASGSTIVDKNFSSILEEILKEQKLIKVELESLKQNASVYRTLHLQPPSPVVPQHSDYV